MARSYHVEIAQHATHAERKWIDNLLSHFDVPGVLRARQGVARRISVSGIYHIALIRQLNHELGISVSAAVPLAIQLLQNQANQVSPWLTLHVDTAGMKDAIDHRIDEAVEVSAPARRGRPRRQLG
jgi:hypothetical protein